MKTWISFVPNRRHPSAAGLGRRAVALLLCLSLLAAAVPVAAAAGHTVRFVNYDLSSLGEEHLFTNVPAGARLYTAEELVQSGVELPPEPGCTWYLYYPGGGDIPSYGPMAIPDPPARDGYLFQDWVAQGAYGDDVYTVTGDTVFVARFVSQTQYILNLYYQFDNDANTVAAETSTTPHSLGETIAVQLPDLPSLEGLSPRITVNSMDADVQDAVAALNSMFQADGTFSGSLDQEFLNHCRAAGFVAWDDTAGDFQKDENGNVQINIPVTYALTGAVTFQVAYYWQDPEDPTQYTLQKTVPGTVTGTTRVSLTEMGLVETYDGFTLTAASREDADSYNINANGTSTIELYYDRNVHFLYYQMHGGNVMDPIQLRYGQTIPQDAGREPVRAGYEFDGWICRDESGAALESVPAVMPDGDLTMEAQWFGTDTTVTLVYWLENANDDSYTVAGQQTVSVTSGQTVGYEAPDGVSEVEVSINAYLTAEAMRGAGIDDGEYFTFAFADSSTEWADGVEGSPKTAAGDGSTVINVGYTRNEYTLVFHLGRINGDTYQVATSTGSDTTDPYDWQSGHFWSEINVHPILTMGGQEYFVDNNNNLCYQITAKYGAYISALWPVATDETVTEAGYDAEWWGETYRQTTYYLFTWGTHYTSRYFQTHSNKNIIGVYPTMSAELIINADHPEIPHHLVGYWSTSSATKNHHYMFEAVPGTDADNLHSISEYGSYWQVATQGSGGWDAVQGLDFYEYSSTEVRTTNTSAQQNAPAFANVTYRYGCYTGDDVYFFYTYNDYTATYHENNANLTDGTPAQVQTVDFHYLADMNLAEELEGLGFDYDYVPWPSYVSSYGNAYTFDGWYTDANLTFPVDWTTENPTSSVNYYAKWKAPVFTLTLIVPGGTLYEDSLRQFEEKGYEYTVTTETIQGETVTTYTVSGIPGGTKASEIVTERHGAQSSHSLAFDYWGYMAYGTEQRYLFDESQLVTTDLTLTARWKTEYTGQYTVRYLTEEPQTNDFGTVEMDGKLYYRLYPDQVVSGVAVGSSVTEEARPVEGYLSQAGAITRVVEGSSLPVTFDFLYSRVSASVTYQVHYVRDVGVDYGRGEPPEDLVRLAEDKTVTVDAASLNQSTIVGESARVIGGYTPRDSWNINFTLSAENAQNHLYIYYVSNTLTVPFQVVYHIQAPDGTYPADAVYAIDGWESLGKVLLARDLAVNYGQYLEDPGELDALLTGHVLDETLTDSHLILTNEEQGNVLHLYMKNGAYAISYHLGGDDFFPAAWEDHDSFLTANAAGDTYSQAVTYPVPALVPQTTPSRLGHSFTGWNTRADGSGDAYTAEELAAAPWYTASGLFSDVHLYAQWEAQQLVAFDLRGGSWNDDSGRFHNTGTAEDPRWGAYVEAGGTCPRPQDPSRVLSDGTAYSFIGWTEYDPDGWTFIDGENRIDLVAFEQYRFDFSQPIQAGTTLYAVWDPDVATVAIEKTDTGGTPLAGAEFTLERLQSTVSGSPDTGYTYELITDGSGAYLPDETFVGRTLVSGEDGNGAFANLSAGYYRLTETTAPDGYQGLQQPVIVFVPYGGEPEIWEPLDHPYVTGRPESGDLNVQIQNIPQYSVTIDAPSSLTLTYESPDLIWNPETLAYEGGGDDERRWQVSAPEGENTAITVTNTSMSAVVQVSVTLQYDAGYQALLPLSTLTGPDGFTEYGTAETKSLQGTLPGAAAAIFRLNAAGTVPLDVALPSEETRVGGITVRVSRTNLLNPAWQSRF